MKHTRILLALMNVAAVGERALRLLESRLVAITFVVPEKSLANLRAIGIELDLDYGDFG